ncbi:ferredoxin [Mycobacterium sp. M26]|uniref:ferredoxin n=1 Tax=Mycobacterium sp. M26 TaxID=1762962 RepID=UPI00073F4112|nr:ferredoxin [Mycobacterium sp. M26]
MSRCRVTVDLERCSGIGLCEAGKPDLFEVGDDGRARLLREDVSADELAELEDVVAQCPTQSVSVELVD